MHKVCTFWKQKSPHICEGLILLAVWTGLEPATPCVTGRYSNQLNYQTNDFIFKDSDNSQIQILFICFFKASANIHCQFRFGKTFFKNMIKQIFAVRS